MKKILQVCAIDGSVDTLLKPLILSLMDRGYTVHNACTDTGKFEELIQEGLHMIDIPIERKIKPRSNFRSVMKLYQIMKKEQYDIVHVHTPVASILGRIAAKWAGVNHIVYTAHGFYFHEGMSKREYRFFYGLEKLFARYFTDWLLLQSIEDYELCKRHRFKKEVRMIHISNGVDIHTKFHPDLISGEVQQRLKREFGIGEHEVVFIFIGRLVKEKGVFELLQAFRSLRDNYENVKLLIVGELLPSERDQGSYEQLSNELREPHILFAGYRDDIPELLSISDVFVLPSYREGLPRSIIEAMALGKPIIATNIRGCREEVTDGKNGFLVKAGSHNELFLKMEYFVVNTPARKRFGDNSRKIVEQQFDEGKVIQKQLSLFAEIDQIGKQR